MAEKNFLTTSPDRYRTLPAQFPEMERSIGRDSRVGRRLEVRLEDC